MAEPCLVASWEPMWSADGAWSGAPAVHVEAEDPEAAAVVALVGAHFVERLDAGLLRLDPSVPLATLAALLRAAGWDVQDAGPGLLFARRS